MLCNLSYVAGHTGTGRVLFHHFKAIKRLHPSASYPQAKILQTNISQSIRRCPSTSRTKHWLKHHFPSWGFWPLTNDVDFRSEKAPDRWWSSGASIHLLILTMSTISATSNPQFHAHILRIDKDDLIKAQLKDTSLCEYKCHLWLVQNSCSTKYIHSFPPSDQQLQYMHVQLQYAAYQKVV